MKNTVFSRHEWYYTAANEDLFTLPPEALYFYRLLVKGASQ